MDVLSSAQFRKQYPRLTGATAVTANGHVIGIWHPRRGDLSEHRDFLPASGHITVTPAERFNSQPFTGPIPKRRER